MSDARLDARIAEILALREKGFNVTMVSKHQFRIDGRLDLFPIHRRFYVLPTLKRGTYRVALTVAVRVLRTPVTA